MKVAALVHFAAPFRNAGSETVLLELMKAATSAGHETIIWCTHRDATRNWKGTEPDTTFDGVTIKRVRNSLIGAQQVRHWGPGVVVSHHQHATQAIKTAKLIGARSVFLTHNQMGAVNKMPIRAHPSLTIHNSQWVRESLADQFGEHGDQMVMHPPLTPDRHLVPSAGEALTLCNLNLHKGAELFYKLAEVMPEREFLGVIGGHGEQVIRRRLPNVTIADHNPDMKRVWAATRVLLMPSVYESYGLTAVEAGINGIPTIANPTPGLLENLGDGGLFADRDSPQEWVRVINQLDQPEKYAHASRHARQVAEHAMTQTRHALKRWVDWVEGV